MSQFSDSGEQDAAAIVYEHVTEFQASVLRKTATILSFLSLNNLETKPT